MLARLLVTVSWAEWRHHPWRYLAAWAAVMLGVALAFAVQLINQSALAAFDQAVRGAEGQADAQLRSAAGDGLDESLLARLARDARVALAQPVVQARAQPLAPVASAQQAATSPPPLRIVGIDTLLAGRLTPALAPRVAAGGARLDVVAPDALFLNPAAQALLAPLAVDGTLALRAADGRVLRLRLAGQVADAGPPLAVMDVAAAQDAFGTPAMPATASAPATPGRLSRIDLQLVPGASAEALRAELPAGVVWSAPGDATVRLAGLSRAYRVNLTALALVALFTGAFLVYAVQALGVAQRAPQIALLGVLGLTPRQRLALLAAESGLLGALGSAAGLALGTALAWGTMQVLGGDLGGGYFDGGQPPALRWDVATAALYGALGVAAALAGGAWPAFAAATLPPAQTLKGLGWQAAGGGSWRGAALLALAAGALALAPPALGVVAGIAWAAYASVAAALLAGVLALPAAVALLTDRLAPWAARRALPMLTLERTRRQRAQAAAAVGGVVTALALSVALTVMVASFRQSVSDWLTQALPADLYLRTPIGGDDAPRADLPPALAPQLAALPGVARVVPQRSWRWTPDARHAPVQVIARPLGAGTRALPLLAPALTPPPGALAVYVSEPMAALHGLRVGQRWPALAGAFSESNGAARARGLGPEATYFIAGVWRDYARPGGAVVLDAADAARLAGGPQALAANELALWLQPGADADAVAAAVRQAATEAGAPALELASTAALRARSLALFDRSFAVTVWLQAVAIGIGLFGVAASFSAQVLARRKEFGLLAHLGLTRRQVLALVSAEGALWSTLGAVVGLVLGVVVALVLVHVVNPRSFHWTMDLHLPLGRLAALGVAVVLAGTLTVALTARASVSRSAVLAVKEDW